MDTVKVDVYVCVHKGLRGLIDRFSFDAGATDWTNPTAVARLHTQWQIVKRLLHSHHDREERFIHPLLARISPGGHRPYDADHRTQEILLADLEAHFEGLVAGNTGEEMKATMGLEFYRGLNLFFAEYLRHMHREETEAERVLHATCPQGELVAVMGRLLASIPEDEMMLWIDCMFPAMNLSECEKLLAGMKACTPPEAYEAMAERAREARSQSNASRLEAMLVR